MKEHAFRYCMLVGAAALAGVAIYYFATYLLLTTALGSSALAPDYQNSIRALWLAFGAQVLLIALLYTLVAFRPHAVTREVIVIGGLLQLTESLLLFRFASNMLAVTLLGIAAVFVMVGSLLWPKVLEPEEEPDAAAEDAAQAEDATEAVTGDPSGPPPRTPPPT